MSNRYVFCNSRFISFLVLFLLLAISLSAKEKIELKGNVLDMEGAGLPSVRVVIHELGRQAFSNAVGTFKFESFEPGTYKLTIGRIGYLTIDTVLSIDKNSHLSFSLEESDIITSDVVITGTRTYKHIENLPMPVEVVSQSEIKKQGYLRLDEVLSQEMGIPMTEDRGRGMQVQGLDADYTLVLLNGEPMSGRTGGVLNISRFSIANLSRIEVVRGPSSSLYGSSALAGVINLITEKPVKPLELGLSGRYGTHNTYDVAGELSSSLFNKKLGIRLFADNYRTEGFSLIPSAVEKTVPPNNNWTLNGEMFYDITSTVTSRLGARHNSEQIGNSYLITNGQDSNLINTDVSNIENNISLNIGHGISNRYNLDFRVYGSDYKTETLDTYDESNDFYDSYMFRHRVGKAELQSTSLLGLHQLTGGFGAQYDEVESGQVDDGIQSTQLYYGYIQDDWQLSETMGVIGSLRFDGHSEYTDNLSPKIAASWNVIPDLYLRASLGSGFKAPTFEQLYLNWSLASEGYSVFGIKNFPKEFAKLSETGQISDTLINLGEVQDLTPEKSWAIDFGGTYSFDEMFEVKLNFFHNNVNGLIEFLPVAIKSNGRLLYTYFNVDRIFTQGIESRIRFKPLNFLNFQLHYQYLLSGDFDVIETLDDPNQTVYWKREGNKDRPVRPEEYGGLFNRSNHSGSVTVEYNQLEWGLLVSMRGVFKSRYGFADINGNTILDDDREYASGYSFWNLLAAKTLFDKFTLQVGVDNMFDYKTENTRLVTSGRTFYFGIIYNLLVD